MTVDDIHRRKGLAIGQKILDYMGSTELIANLFRISQTEEKLRKDQVSTSDAATAVHYAVGNEVREAIRKIDGTMPEDLPTPEKSIAQLEREQMERLKQKAIDGQLMLDEYDAMNHPVPEAIWWISGSKLLVPPFIEGFLSYLREYLKELEVM